MENDAFKACPFCKEQIRKEAVKCRFCGEWLEQQSPSLPPQPQQTIVAGDLADINIESLSTCEPQPEKDQAWLETVAFGASVFRDLQESLNLNPSREQWEHEFLTRIPPQEPIPPHILEELWKDSGAAGRKPAPNKDAARAEQSELFVGGGGTSTGETRRGLKWMNGIFMVLYGYGFGANIFDGNISRKSTGFVLAIVSSGSILVAASLFGFLAARNPTHMTRRKLAKWSNVLVVVLALFTLLRSLIIGGTTHGQTGYVGSTILYGFILGAFLALPALINLRAFWKLTSTVELPTKLDNEAQYFEPPNQEQAGLVAEYPVTEQTESDNNSPEEPPITNEQNEQHTEAVKEDSQATAPAKSSNYIVRHWRGDLSLGISYWANGVLVSFLILLASNMLDVLDAMHDSISLQLVFTLSLLVFATAIVASVWQSVGIWRSASKHVSRGGKSIWATLAKIAVILGLLNCIVQLCRIHIPQ